MKTIRTTPMLRASAIGATFFASLALTPFLGAETAQAATIQPISQTRTAASR